MLVLAIYTLSALAILIVAALVASVEVGGAPAYGTPIPIQPRRRDVFFCERSRRWRDTTTKRFVKVN